MVQFLFQTVSYHHPPPGHVLSVDSWSCPNGVAGRLRFHITVIPGLWRRWGGWHVSWFSQNGHAIQYERVSTSTRTSQLALTIPILTCQPCLNIHCVLPPSQKYPSLDTGLHDHSTDYQRKILRLSLIGHCPRYKVIPWILSRIYLAGSGGGMEILGGQSHKCPLQFLFLPSYGLVGFSRKLREFV